MAKRGDKGRAFCIRELGLVLTDHDRIGRFEDLLVPTVLLDATEHAAHPILSRLQSSNDDGLCAMGGGFGG